MDPDRDPFAAGTLNLAQARVIADALAALPKDLGEDLLAKAETLMLTEANQLGPRELRIFGARLLDTWPPTSPRRPTTSGSWTRNAVPPPPPGTLRRRGDGSTDLHARIPDLTASLLRTFLAAFTAPRRHQPHESAAPRSTGTDEFARLPLARQQGIALVALLERILKTDLPRHGGMATSLVVLIDHDTLLADLTAAGIAQTTTGERSPPAKPDAWPARPHHPRSATSAQGSLPKPRAADMDRDPLQPALLNQRSATTTPAGTSTTTPTAPPPSPDANSVM